MSFGRVSPFSITLASAATNGSKALGAGFSTVVLEIPTMASGSDINILGSSDGTTYRAVRYSIQSGTASPGALTIASGITNTLVPIEFFGLEYIRLQLTTATTDTSYTFKIICS